VDKSIKLPVDCFQRILTRTK
ncbi:hypothetical protein CCACVL1_02248, partial [Corchorus capsularis]